jgi:hypothetical protein
VNLVLMKRPPIAADEFDILLVGMLFLRRHGKKLLPGMLAGRDSSPNPSRERGELQIANWRLRIVN